MHWYVHMPQSCLLIPCMFVSKTLEWLRMSHHKAQVFFLAFHLLALAGCATCVPEPLAGKHTIYIMCAPSVYIPLLALVLHPIPYVYNILCMPALLHALLLSAGVQLAWGPRFLLLLALATWMKGVCPTFAVSPLFLQALHT